MKIGILTFHFAYNYGAMLQAYALSKKLLSYDFDCEIIDYRPRVIDYLYHAGFSDFKARPKEFVVDYLRKKKSHADFREFEDFLNNELNLNHSSCSGLDITKSCSMYDAVIAGSDQIWNDKITNSDTAYLLKGVAGDTIKIAYAASIGVTDISPLWEKELKNCLPEFDFISTREMQSCNYINSILKSKKVVDIPDPVFLFEKNDWARLSRKLPHPDKYILYYSLSDNEQLKADTLQLSRETGLPLIGIHPLYRSRLQCSIYHSDIGPKQFIWLIQHAEYVCTDSFHATAFSAIFEKRLLIRRDLQANGRVQNLFEQIKPEKEKNGSLENIFFFPNTKLLSRYRQKGENYLDEIAKNIRKKEVE